MKSYPLISLLLLVALHACSPGIDQEKLLSDPERYVEVSPKPDFPFRFAEMRKGVLQHIDREYTYDVLPEPLRGGLLFQGIHRIPESTSIEIRLRGKMYIYVLFHQEVNGGYDEIFSKLPGWEACEAAPRYDIHNGDHGLHMQMYRMLAGPGRILIPATTEDRACMSLVFTSGPL